MDDVKMMPGRNGGRLRRGSAKGNTAGPGRPRDVIKLEYLQLISEHGIALLRDIVAGKVKVPVERACEFCGKKPSVPAAKPRELLELVPDLNTRIRALAEANRYGLGGQDVVTVIDPEVKRAVEGTARLILSRPTWDSQELYIALKEVWK